MGRSLKARIMLALLTPPLVPARIHQRVSLRALDIPPDLGLFLFIRGHHSLKCSVNPGGIVEPRTESDVDLDLNPHSLETEEYDQRDAAHRRNIIHDLRG